MNWALRERVVLFGEGMWDMEDKDEEELLTLPD